MQGSEVASLYCSGIAATSATNNLLWHWLSPLSHWLIVLLTPCKHAADLLSHASFCRAMQHSSMPANATRCCHCNLHWRCRRMPPSSHQLIVFLTPCVHTANLLSHAHFFAEQCSEALCLLMLQDAATVTYIGGTTGCHCCCTSWLFFNPLCACCRSVVASIFFVEQHSVALCLPTLQDAATVTCIGSAERFHHWSHSGATQDVFLCKQMQKNQRNFKRLWWSYKQVAPLQWHC